jgi:ABC-type uncharacterized transport system ATPase subunit
MNATQRPPVLELSGITMHFGPLVANDGISITLGEGEILALLGENGAGKTTLMNILFGHYAADEGTVRVFGDTLPPGKPRAAIEAGVGMVHQHFTLAGNLTVLENVMLGSQPLTKLIQWARDSGEKAAGFGGSVWSSGSSPCPHRRPVRRRAAAR